MKRTETALLTFLLLLCMASLFPPLPAGAQAAPGKQATPKRAIVLFDDVKGDFVARAGAVQIANLLGHFGIASYMEPVSLYEKGDLKKFQIAFFAGCQKDYTVPADLLADILDYKDKFFWIGNHIDQLLKKDEKKELGIEYISHTDDVRTINYKGTELSKDAHPPVLEVKTESKVKVHAWAQKGTGKIPYIMTSGNFWFIADIPFSYVQGVDRYIAFCDVLHDFLGEAHTNQHRTYVRVEDVSPTTDPEHIKEIADILSELNVPFMIALVPIYMDPTTDQEIPLSSRPRLVRALKYAISKGGSIVLHGATHQRKGTSLIDAEFWDEEAGRPVKDDSPRFVEKKLKLAMEECFKCTIYPLLWETPQYLASAVDYRVIARHFSTTTDRRIFFDRIDLTQSFPYLIEKDVYGQRLIIPEYLGFVPYMEKEGKQDVAAEKEAAGKIVDMARKMLCLRDNVAGFCFHPFLEPSILKELVKNLKEAGYVFVDARDFNNTVVQGDHACVSGKGDIKLNLNNKYLREYYFDEKGRVRKEKISATKLTSIIKRSIACKPKWIYAAEGIDEKPHSSIKRFFADIAQKMTPQAKEEHPSPVAAIIWKEQAPDEEMRDQQAFLTTLESLGIKTRKLNSLASLSTENLLVIPYGSAKDLKEDDATEHLVPFFGHGGTLVIDGFTPVSKALGFHRAGKVEIKEVRDVYNDLQFFTSGIMEIASPTSNDRVVYQSADGFPLGMVRREKEGGVFFLTTMYDPISGKGYSRFPTLINTVLDYFKFEPPAFNPRLEAYFDPGLRENESVEVLAKRWRKLGIRSIHVAAWHFYPSYVFDYKRLLGVCHKQGISVYAWIELPYLTQTFWNKNPRFREKNYKGTDLKQSWRYPLALEDRECKDAVYGELRKLLTDYEFDGVNIAELYFEGEGLNRPETYGPFHPSAQKLFKEKYKYSMTELFTPSAAHYYKKNEKAQREFFNFREDLIYELHHDLLMFLDGIRKEKKDLDIVFTIVDSIKSPEVRENWGVNSQRLTELLKEIPFTFIVEDPQRMWELSPGRYDELREAYLQLGVPPRQLGIDLNVVDGHKVGGNFACRKQAGAELFQMIRSASRGGVRVLVYAESSIVESDLPFLSSAVELPPGVTTPSPQKEILDPIHLLWTSGDLLRLEERGGENILSYDSPAACYVALNREPVAVWVDDEKKRQEFHMGTGEWILRLPSGHHVVRIVGESRLSFDVEVFSYFEAQLLLVFGIVSCGLLLLLFTFNRLRRRKNV
jgi:uncharacterized protein YdaL